MIEFVVELGVVMQYLALRDECQNNIHSSKFCMQKMGKFEELLLNCLYHKELREMIKDE